MGHLAKPACIGDPYSQPDLVCDACPWVGKCVEEVLK